ncbi:shikimate kinase [Desulfuribacillus alkaliarsenatis]|uniref:Shikimate kinase n=1 Tax=Desulfuribacillus alkaliarsenatis TaxID=766136 RepID=A0A1E5G5E5_9FIRM|nr:shikimate kinase [Desulfuribacillus alkaliarsenatis]OEF98410.1 hypothetical protein BHF68_01655 [Desulfuribacillus alkaliarsenatis]
MAYNIYLVGMMGTGKTTIGKKLAEHLNRQFIDIDQYIVEEHGRSISDIFATNGEAYFRDLETDALRTISDKGETNPAVVATGGGAFERELNRKILMDSGKIVWLTTSIEEIVKRLNNDTTRPLLQTSEKKGKSQDSHNNELEQRITTLMASREHNYRLADIHVTTDNKSPEDIVEEITAKLPIKYNNLNG